MARARRAKARPARIVVPLVVIALLAVGGAVGATQGWFTSANRSTTNSPARASATDQLSAPESPSPETTATPSEKVSTSPSAAAAGRAELKGCRDKVEAADRVLAAAEVGVGHWSEHVQAQTDANAGDITAGEMDAIFKRTRLAGPDDVSDYADAEQGYADETGSCDPVPEAATATSDDLSACSKRSQAQQPVLDAAADAMADWKSHLAAMKRSRMGHVHDAQGVWIKAWRAAPPHIKAFRKAVDRFDAPDC